MRKTTVAKKKSKPTKKKRPTDLNRLAASIVADATGEEEPEENDGKDPAAVSLGRRGGLKGGTARAKKLSKKRRTAIAKAAASARWGKKKVHKTERRSNEK